MEGGEKMTQTMTDEEYKDVIKNATKPVVLEFGAEW